MAGTGLAARGEGRGTDVRRDGRDRDGDEPGGPRGPGLGEDSGGATGADAEPGPEGAVRVCDAGAFGGPGSAEQAFARFQDVKNRSHEPWVLEAMRYLNHPLREAHARRFVRPALELLPEIQRTGDIFFPKRWADAPWAGIVLRGGGRGARVSFSTSGAAGAAALGGAQRGGRPVSGCRPADVTNLLRLHT